MMIDNRMWPTVLYPSRTTDCRFTPFQPPFPKKFSWIIKTWQAQFQRTILILNLHHLNMNNVNIPKIPAAHLNFEKSENSNKSYSYFCWILYRLMNCEWLVSAKFLYKDFAKAIGNFSQSSTHWQSDADRKIEFLF